LEFINLADLRTPYLLFSFALDNPAWSLLV
jgi:hypothetical protein